MRSDLDALLRSFTFRARIFFSGQLCTRTQFEEDEGHLHLLQSGAVDLVHASQPTRRITAPALIFFPGAKIHALVPDEPDGVHLACASIHLGLHRAHPLMLALPEVLHVQLEAELVLSRVLDALFLEADANNIASAPLLDRLAEVALMIALRIALQEEPRQRSLLHALTDPRLARALHAIHQAPEHPWTLAELANCAGMSRARFAAYFHDLVGVTPGDYLGHWRIGVAQRMLVRGEPLKLIADAAGYSNTSALARAFVQYTGDSPTAWRAIHQGNRKPANESGP